MLLFIHKRFHCLIVLLLFISLYMLTTWFRTPKTTARTKSITQLLNYRRPLSSSTTVFKMPAPFQYKQPEHRLTLIPGPIEFSDDVLASMAIPSQAHTSPDFIYTFQYVLQNLRKLFKSTDANTQGYVLSGSGTLGWDVAATNIIEPGEKVLVLSTGFFSDSFAECLKVYGADVDVITAEIGDVVPLDKIKDQLQKEKYAAITITHVDTSTSVVSDVEAISKVVKEVSPETLIIVDGVCSVGVEDIEFDKWGLDFVLTASQKAIGVPAGLSIFYASERALSKALNKEKGYNILCQFEKMDTNHEGLRKWIRCLFRYTSSANNYCVEDIIGRNLCRRIGQEISHSS